MGTYRQCSTTYKEDSILTGLRSHMDNTRTNKRINGSMIFKNNHIAFLTWQGYMGNIAFKNYFLGSTKLKVKCHNRGPSKNLESAPFPRCFCDFLIAFCRDKAHCHKNPHTRFKQLPQPVSWLFLRPHPYFQPYKMRLQEDDHSGHHTVL